jgi:hypothetical protein
MGNFANKYKVMKTKTNLLAASLVVGLIGCCSEFKILSADVPPEVLSAFQSKYPKATNVEWEAEKTEGHLAFEAEFKVDGKRKEAYFKPDGAFLKEE